MEAKRKTEIKKMILDNVSNFIKSQGDKPDRESIQGLASSFLELYEPFSDLYADLEKVLALHRDGAEPRKIVDLLFDALMEWDSYLEEYFASEYPEFSEALDAVTDEALKDEYWDDEG